MEEISFYYSWTVTLVRAAAKQSFRQAFWPCRGLVCEFPSRSVCPI